MTAIIPIDEAEARARAGMEWYQLPANVQECGDFESLVKRHLCDVRKERLEAIDLGGEA